ncbi:MAG TPA: hypothetical protein VLC53_15545, partial [Myxococcota bacterium]|nr:hypothetical protein [Myxococcota bacterium]
MRDSLRDSFRDLGAGRSEGRGARGRSLRTQKPAARRRRTPRADGASLAARADKYALYQQAVQDPEGDVVRVRRMFERLHGRTP